MHCRIPGIRIVRAVRRFIQTNIPSCPRGFLGLMFASSRGRKQPPRRRPSFRSSNCFDPVLRRTWGVRSTVRLSRPCTASCTSADPIRIFTERINRPVLRGGGHDQQEEARSLHSLCVGVRRGAVSNCGKRVRLVIIFINTDGGRLPQLLYGYSEMMQGILRR